MKKYLISILALSIWIATATAGPASSVPTARNGITGKDIYEGRCAGVCHQSPPLRSLSKGQWRVVLNTMQKRMASRDMEPLNDEETELLLQFLTEVRPK